MISSKPTFVDQASPDKLSLVKRHNTIYSRRTIRSDTKSLQKSMRGRNVAWRPPKQFVKVSFDELIKSNYVKAQYKLFKYKKKAKSSESKQEGRLASRKRYVLLALQYFLPNHLRRQLIMKAWKVVIHAVRAVIRYKQVRVEALKALRETRLKMRENAMLLQSTDLSPQRYRRRGGNSVPSQDFFNLYPVNTTQPDESKQIERDDKFLKSKYYADYQRSDKRLQRVLCVQIRCRSIQLPSIQKAQSTIIVPSSESRTLRIQRSYTKSDRRPKYRIN